MRKYLTSFLLFFQFFQLNGQTFTDCSNNYHTAFNKIQLQRTLKQLDSKVADSLIFALDSNLDSCIVGKEVPAYSLVGLSGKTYTNESLKGKIVVFNFWSVNCGPCVMEIPVLNRLYQSYRDSEDFMLISILSDKEEALEKLLEKGLTKRRIVYDSESNVDSVKARDDSDNSDCIRGQAQSVTKKTIYPNAIFKLNSDKHTGTETVDLKNGERLIINNWGCEYFVLTFRIETDRFQADTTNTIYWLDKAAILMNEIQDGIDAPMNIQSGIEAIPLYLASMDSRIYELGKEIVFKDDIIRDFVTLDRVQKINDKRFAVEISFATGPL